MVNSSLLVQRAVCASAAFEVLLANDSFGSSGMFPSARCSSCIFNFAQQPCRSPSSLGVLLFFSLHFQKQSKRM